ncbi:MAG: patatin-like phospholipase family protein, partial [Candidatus Omnitrophica bacterium]|nr:patatin-like phospholipase family protein [Candidatus Omnitrophota bacterium]
PEDFPTGPNGVKVYPILAISGGGANGAYGAGLLKGWSEEGSRPVFKVITGVSTGAIIAPFAFLGKEYDDELEKVYTTMSTKDVMTNKLPFMILFGDSLASNAPLARTIAKMTDKKILEKIAAQHKRGRRLFVGTANLDAERFVIWDMGAIACRGDVELFRKIILTSAAIPMVFPPAIFHVEAGGKAYDEMHADGGTLTQVFVTYKLLDGMGGIAKTLGIDPSKIRGKLYIIRNGYMSPVYSKVKDDLASLAQRSFDMLIDSQGVGDIYRIYTFTKEKGNDYNLAFIPADFKQHNEEMFDPKEMRRLFNRGYEDAVGGYKWHKVPPGMDGPFWKPEEASK